MKTSENPEKLGPSCLVNPQSADSSLDPVNPLLWYNPRAANAYSATFSQEAYNFYPRGDPHEFVAEKNGDSGSPGREVKIVESIACTSPAAQGFPSSEEQISADVSGNKRCLELAGEIADSEPSQRRKIRKMEKGPRYVFKARSETDVLEDGYKWRKYGRKLLRSSPHPRSYYRCSESNCSVKKRVEREASDPGLLITTYEGTHNHESPSVIYYIGKPIILPQLPGSKPAIVLVNAGVCPEAVFTFASQQAL
jgi:hypothetical protein